MKKDYSAICKQYFEAIQAGDTEAILALFRTDGIVQSPLYGQQACRTFYEKLAEDTNDSHINLLRVLTTEQAAAAHFTYHWTLKNGKAFQFEGVDLFDFDEQGLIRQLTIIYDTEATRDEWQQL